MSGPRPLRRLAVFCSGSGTNFQAVLDAQPASAYDVAVMVCNQREAGAIARAEAAKVPVVIEPHRAHPDRASFERALLEHLAAYDVDAVVLAGFMRILSPVFLQGFGRPVINVHPALLPAFPGMHAARQALEAGVAETGCTVHLVDEGVDTGPALAQAKVPIAPGDTEATLQARIQQAEHQLLPQVLDRLAREGLSGSGAGA